MRWRPRCYDRVRSNFRMRWNLHAAEDLCAGANVDMAMQHRSAAATAGAKCHLLKYQTVRSDFGIGMNHDAIWVGHQQPSTNGALNGNVGPRNHAPKPILKNVEFSSEA